MENTKRAVVVNELEGDEYGKVRPVGKQKGVEIPNELQRDKRVEKDEKDEKDER